MAANVSRALASALGGLSFAAPQVPMVRTTSNISLCARLTCLPTGHESVVADAALGCPSGRRDGQGERRSSDTARARALDAATQCALGAIGDACELRPECARLIAAEADAHPSSLAAIVVGRVSQLVDGLPTEEVIMAMSPNDVREVRDATALLAAALDLVCKLVQADERMAAVRSGIAFVPRARAPWV